MNHTWFASSFDTDDVPFRLLTLVQMAGVLVLAAGVPGRARGQRLPGGHVRLPDHARRPDRALAAGGDRGPREPRRPPCATSRGSRSPRSAGCCGWSFADAGVLSDDALLAMFVALVAMELSVPLWAERKRPTSWHPHHIAERHGLFAIILLGESVLAASIGRATVARGRRRQRAARRASASARSCSSSRSGGSTSCSRSPKGSSHAASGRTSGATATTACSRRSRASAPGSRPRSCTLGHHGATSAVAVALRRRGPGGRVPHARVGAARAAHRPAGAASVGDARRRRGRPAAPARRTRRSRSPSWSR